MVAGPFPVHPKAMGKKRAYLCSALIGLQCTLSIMPSSPPLTFSYQKTAEKFLVSSQFWLLFFNYMCDCVRHLIFMFDMFPHDIKRPMLDFLKDTAYVFTNDPDAHQFHTAEKELGRCKGRPSGQAPG